MIETEAYGYYHVTNVVGYICWYVFACEIFHQEGDNSKVIPVIKKNMASAKLLDLSTAVWNAAVGFKAIDAYKGTASTRDDCLQNGTKLNLSQKNQKRPEWNTEQK